MIHGLANVKSKEYIFVKYFAVATSAGVVFKEQ